MSDQGESVFDFTVNRNGSCFWIEDEDYMNTVRSNRYVCGISEELKIYESDVNPIDPNKVEIKLQHNGNIDKLEYNKDYHIYSIGEDNEWNQYEYRIEPKRFEDEGKYSIYIESTNQAGGKDYSDKNKKLPKMEFVVDKSKPNVELFGLEEDGSYLTDEQKVIATVSDLSGLESFQVEVFNSDNERLEEYTCNLQDLVSDEEKLADIIRKGGDIEFSIPEGSNMSVKISCADRAVNLEKGKNHNVYTKILENITVSQNRMVLLMANKTLVYGIIAGLVVMIFSGSGVVFFRRRRKKNN